MTSGPAPELHLRELARLRRVRDRIEPDTSILLAPPVVDPGVTDDVL